MTGPINQRGVTLVELLLAVTISLIVVAIATPSFRSTLRNYRASGDARDVAAEILLAKMRAASDFTQARAYFDTSANTFRLEIWNKATNAWVPDNPTGTLKLSSGITVAYSPQGNPPPNTQATIAQSPGCYPGSGTNPGGGSAVSNTACVVFNSRGIPIDPTTNNATGNAAIYITDGVGVYASTVSATGNITSWRIDSYDTNQTHWKKR